MNNGELLSRAQKNFKGFKTLKKIKLTDTRMIVQPGKNGDSDQIVAIFMRRDLENIASIFKGKYMKIKRIEFMEEITDVHNDNMDVLAENEDGYNYIVSVGTPQDLLEEMNQEKANFVRPGTPKSIVKKLTKEIVTEAIEAYAETLPIFRFN
jgi:hypothetical protein